MPKPTLAEPQERDSPEKNRGWFFSTKFWSGFATALALLATLWSTLVGRTLPDLLSSHKSAVVEFRAEANRLCARLPNENSLTTGSFGNPQPPITPDAANTLLHQFSETLDQPFDRATQQLVALAPPAAYQQTYTEFENRIVAGDQAMAVSVGAMSDLAGGVVNAESLNATMSAIRHAGDEVVAASNDSELMQLTACVGALGWASERLVDAGSRIATSGVFKFNSR